MTNSTPPRVPLAFRVGIVGHRPNRLQMEKLDVLRATIKAVLSEIRTSATEFHRDNPSLYATAPVLRAITPLAEGTDRLFAEAALDLQYAICCPMPFHQAEYERDFVPDHALEDGSLSRFRDFLARASKGPGLVTFELDGDRADVGDAYGAAGRVVLNQSDLLVVVWDGEKPEGRGGTVDTLREAVAYRVPIVWIDAMAPSVWCVLGDEPDLRCLEGEGRCVPHSEGSAEIARLHKVVRDALELPGGDKEGQAQFFAESKPRFNLAFAWKLFRGHLGEGRLRLQSPRVPDFEQSVAGEWSTAGGGAAAWVNERLREHYAWSDKLADYYADHHRSAAVLAFPLAALAVLFALLSGLFDVGAHQRFFEMVLVLLEFSAIIWIIYLIQWARHRGWHDRWLDYRILAESIRQVRILIPLGGGRPISRLPSHLKTYGGPSQTWMAWHSRAIVRAVGLPSAIVDQRYVRECLDYLRGTVDDQLRFHKTNRARSDKIERRLHRLAILLLIATVAAMVIHLVPLAVGDRTAGHHLRPWVALCCAFFPALGAAFAGINNQGEFARLEKRSRAMEERLRILSDELGHLAQSSGGIKLKQITPHALNVAQLMLDEVLDWRVIFIDRPLVVQ